MNRSPRGGINSKHEMPTSTVAPVTLTTLCASRRRTLALSPRLRIAEMVVGCFGYASSAGLSPPSTQRREWQHNYAIIAFRTQATRHWCHALRRRSQRSRLDWDRMNRLATRWLPPARVTHPYPEVRFDARTQGRSPVR